MKAKIISVSANSDFMAIRIGQRSRSISADEYLESELQHFLDDHPDIDLKHVEYSSICVVPKMPSWDTTNSDVDWEIEKSVLLFFEESA